jgi:hypothetical protein
MALDPTSPRLWHGCIRRGDAFAGFECSQAMGAEDAHVWATQRAGPGEWSILVPACRALPTRPCLTLSLLRLSRLDLEPAPGTERRDD